MIFNVCAMVGLLIASAIWWRGGDHLGSESLGLVIALGGVFGGALLQKLFGKDRDMVCFGLPSGFVALVLAAVVWKAWALITAVAYWTFVVLGWVAYAAVGAVAAVILSAAVTLVLYVGHRIRRWRQARGACLRCTHPCTGELGELTGAEIDASPVAVPVDLPMPRRVP